MLPLCQFPKSGLRTDSSVARWTSGLTTTAHSTTSPSGSRGRRRHHHRCRAVARLPQPGHGVRQLVVVRVGDGVPAPGVWDTTNDGYELTHSWPGSRSSQLADPSQKSSA